MGIPWLVMNLPLSLGCPWATVQGEANINGVEVIIVPFAKSSHISS